MKRPSRSLAPSVALGLGANLGSRAEIEDRFHHALAALASPDDDGLRLEELRVASLYRTRALSPDGEPIDQPDYLNTAAVAEVRPAASLGDAPRLARRLLARCKELEAAAGRDLSSQGARPLDLDLLLLADAEIDLPPRSDLPHGLWPGSVHVPHRRLGERLFVLRPLAELAPERKIPGDGRTVTEALQDLRETLRQTSRKTLRKTLRKTGDGQPVQRVEGDRWWSVR